MAATEEAVRGAVEVERDSGGDVMAKYQYLIDRLNDHETELLKLQGSFKALIFSLDVLAHHEGSGATLESIISGMGFSDLGYYLVDAFETARDDVGDLIGLVSEFKPESK